MSTGSDEFDAATRRGAAVRKRGPVAIAARYDRRRSRVVVALDSGVELAFRPRDAQGLEHAQVDQLVEIEVSPSGLGLRFPQLDADLYLPALLEGLLGSRRWMASEIARRGGQRTSKAKTAAARRNGRLGGRPRNAAT